MGFDPPAAIVTGSLRPPGECEEIPRRRLRPTSRSGALALPTGPLRAQRAPHTIGSGGAAKSPDRESERERGPHCHTGASLTPLRLVKVCSARALAHSHSVVLGACTLGSVGRRSRTRLRPGRPGAAGSRKSPTYSRGCKQATSVLSEWPSTEVPSGPRRLRVACFTARPNTIFNFVVKARMEIRASAASSNRLNT